MAIAAATRDNIGSWLALNKQSTSENLQQSLRDNQAVNLALAGSALEQIGANERTKQTIDWYKWQDAQTRKSRRQELALSLLGGVGTAGRRVGVTPSQMATIDPNALLQSLNAFNAGLTTLGDTSPDYASRVAQAAQYMPGLANIGRSNA